MRSSMASWLLQLLKTFWVLSYLTLWNLTLFHSLRTNLILPWVPPHCFTAISVPWAAFHFFQKVTYRGVIYIQ